MQPFLEALDARVLVCDGAMGTMLYAQGVFINRCFDSLNLSDPARVLAVHHAYARGAVAVLPALEDYEKRHGEGKISPLPAQNGPLVADDATG